MVILFDTSSNAAIKCDAEKDWPGIRDMPEYENMKRLDLYELFSAHQILHR